MSAISTPHPAGREFFTAPAEVNQRRYEALRAYHVEDLTLAAAGQRFGYTRATMASLVRDFRAGRLKLFTPPGKPGRSSAPATDRARGRVVELRRQGLSVHEISSKLADEGTPLNRTSVGQILTEEGFGRLLRGPARFASVNPATAGRDTRLPRVATIDFTDTPDTATTSMAGLLLLLPDLLHTLDLPGLVTAAGYPGTRTVPAISWICSLLALKLTNTRRVSHVDDLTLRPRCGPVRRPADATEEERPVRLLPPAHPHPPTPTPHRPRPSHDRIRARHRRAGHLRPGLPRRHALGRRPRPGKALRAHPLPTRPLRAHLLRPGQRHPQPRLRQRRPIQDHPGTPGHRLLRPLEKRLRRRPTHAGHGPEGHHPHHPRRTRRPRRQVPHPTHALTGAHGLYQRPHPGRLQNDHPGPFRQPHQTQSPRHHRCETHRLPRHRPPTHRHRTRPRHPHRDHHQRPHHPHENAPGPLRPTHDHRTTPRRDHPRLPPRRPVLNGQPQRRPRCRPLRPRSSRHRRLPHPPRRRLHHRHPRRPPTPIPPNRRRNYPQRPHDDCPYRQARLLTRAPPRRTLHRHRRPLVGQPPPPLRIRLNLGSKKLYGNPR